MVKFVCKKCNYAFEAERRPPKCPYCGEEEVIKEPNAQELINLS